MHPAYITAALKSKGKTQYSIAVELDLRPVTVCSVIQGRARSHRIADHISAIVGLPVEQLWPGAYEYAPRKHRKSA